MEERQMNGNRRNCIEGSVVFVTGASGGIGQEWVGQALERGAAKVYAADIVSRNWDSDRVISLELDVTDEQSIARSAMLASDTTILINNAGVSLRDKMAEVASDKLRWTFDINFFGPVALS
jgi:NAD(P)-dependent dehydrogenase (short-subunit alcohol dehydrogenase family)